MSIPRKPVTRSHPERARPPAAPTATEDMLIGALLRVPAQAIHRRIIRDLNQAGFSALRLPHMAVLQFPGPDGVRPGTLAARAGVSKQAMNQLLRSLESLGYLERTTTPGRARLVRLTRRGRSAYRRIHAILRALEREWSSELGAREFAQLKRLLRRVWQSPLTRPSTSPSSDASRGVTLFADPPPVKRPTLRLAPRSRVVRL